MQIFVFGASSTYGVWDEKGGWVSRIRQELDKLSIADKGYYIIYNLGISGNTTKDILGRFDNELKDRLTDCEEGEEILMLFSLGNNDSSTTSDGKIIVPLLEYESNTRLLIEKAFGTTKKVAVMSAFPADEAKTRPVSWADRHYTNASLESYSKATKVICKEKGVLFIDIYSKFAKKDYKPLLHDGLHPNSKGHQKIYKSVMKALKKAGYL